MRENGGGGSGSTRSVVVAVQYIITVEATGENNRIPHKVPPLEKSSHSLIQSISFQTIQHFIHKKVKSFSRFVLLCCWKWVKAGWKKLWLSFQLFSPRSGFCHFLSVKCVSVSLAKKRLDAEWVSANREEVKKNQVEFKMNFVRSRANWSGGPVQFTRLE